LVRDVAPNALEADKMKGKAVWKMGKKIQVTAVNEGLTGRVEMLDGKTGCRKW